MSYETLPLTLSPAMSDLLEKVAKTSKGFLEPHPEASHWKLDGEWFCKPGVERTIAALVNRRLLRLCEFKEFPSPYGRAYRITPDGLEALNYNPASFEEAD